MRIDDAKVFLPFPSMLMKRFRIRKVSSRTYAISVVLSERGHWYIRPRCERTYRWKPNCAKFVRGAHIYEINCDFETKAYIEMLPARKGRVCYESKGMDLQGHQKAPKVHDL
jgi:hypothetical protein